MNIVYNIAVIGAGQLGSRHLQGLSKSINKFNIFIVDPSELSLSETKARLAEVDNKFVNSISFLNDLTKLPPHIDIAIIATTAVNRRSVLENLVAITSVDYLILEKISFNSFNLKHIYHIYLKF